MYIYIYVDVHIGIQRHVQAEEGDVEICLTAKLQNSNSSANKVDVAASSKLQETTLSKNYQGALPWTLKVVPLGFGDPF